MTRFQTAARHLRLAARALWHGLPPIAHVETPASGGRELRNPRALKAAIEPLTTTFAARAADHVDLDVRVTNLGDTRWLHRASDIGGQVRLGGHLVAEDGDVLRIGHASAPLSQDVAPGETVILHLRIPTPDRPGRYAVSLDMVDEWIVWFEQCGSHCARLDLDVTSFRDSRDPHRLAARITRVGDWPAGPVRPGSPIATRLRLENVGDTAWHPGLQRERGAVSLAAALVDAAGEMLALDHFRQSLLSPVKPGETLEIDVRVPAPPDAGPHRLRFDLVAEGVCWFWQLGSETLELPIAGSDETPDSTAPGRLLARIERVGAPPDAPLTGMAYSFTFVWLRVVNTGNTRWLASPDGRVGHVGVGGHLQSTGGEEIVPDFFRAPLPRDVAPGESIEFECAVGLPHAAGRYRLAIDMIDEGVRWFAAAGSEPLVLALHLR